MLSLRNGRLRRLIMGDSLRGGMRCFGGRADARRRHFVFDPSAAPASATSLAPLSQARRVSFAGRDDPGSGRELPDSIRALKDSKTGQPFPLFAALNENARLPENLRQRYVVADLNTTNENGYCRGGAGICSRPLDELSEFPRLRAIAAARGVGSRRLGKGERVGIAARVRGASGDASWSRGRARGSQELSPAGPALPHRPGPRARRNQRLLHGTDVEPVRNRQRPAAARVSLRDIIERVAAAALPLLCAHQRHQVAELELGSPIHGRPMRAATRAWAAEAPGSYRSPTTAIRSRCRTSCISCRRTAIPDERANGIHQIAGGLNSGDLSIRSAGQPRVHPPPPIPVQGGPVVDADAGEGLHPFRAQPLPYLRHRGHGEGARVPASSPGESRARRSSHGAAGTSRATEPSQERANGQAGCALPLSSVRLDLLELILGIPRREDAEAKQVCGVLFSRP